MAIGASAQRGLVLLCISAFWLTCGEARPLDMSSLLSSAALHGVHGAGPGRQLLEQCFFPVGGSCPSDAPYRACCGTQTCTAYFHDYIGCGDFECASSSATVQCCPSFDYYNFCPTSGGTCNAPQSGSNVLCGSGFYSSKSFVGCCDPVFGLCDNIYTRASCGITCTTGAPSCCTKSDSSVYTCPSNSTSPTNPPPTNPPPTNPPPTNPPPTNPPPTNPPPTPAPTAPAPTPAPTTPAPTLPPTTPAPVPVNPAPTTPAPTLPPTTPAPAPVPVPAKTPPITVPPPVIAPAVAPAVAPTPVVSTVVTPVSSPPVVNPLIGVPASAPGTLPPSPPPNSQDKSGSSIGIIAGAVGATGAVFAAIAGLALCCILKRNKRRAEAAAAGKLPGGDDNPKDAAFVFAAPPVLPVLPQYGAYPAAPISTGGASSASRQSAPLQGVSSRVFSYEELLAFTNGFNAANLIGQGGYSTVYQATLADGTAAAVKVLRSDRVSGPDDATFFSEMAVMSRLRHKYLLSMLGYASAGTERILVLELCRGGNLYDALHGSYKLDWNKRLRTALDVTIGLEYLHEGVEPPIFHRDIKSANVLFVDETKSVAKLSDFGVAKYEEGAQSANTRVLGTQGYVAPEYAQSGQVSKASDVYSHGVLLAELITGRACVFQNGTEIVTLRNWVVENKHQPLALVDPALGQNFHPQQVIGLVQLVVECLNQDRPKDRPTMSQIHRRIEALIHVAAAPPFARAPSGASQALSTTEFNTMNIPVAQVVGGPPTGSSVTSGGALGRPYSGGSSSYNESYGGARSAGVSGPPSSELNMTVLQPFTNIIRGR